MTIKTKLTVNVAIILAIVAAVAAASTIGMEFIKSKLSYLTERSTPYQVRTNEFQRTMQAAAADLAALSSSKSADEYKSYRAEAEKSLSEVKNTQGELETLTGAKIETYGELSNISAELFGATGERLKAEQNAAAAHDLFHRKLYEAAGRLRGLDAKIKGLQAGRSTAFSGAMENTKGVSTKFRNIELLKSALKDFHLAVSDIGKAATKRGVTVGRGKAVSAMNITVQNPEAKRLSAELKFLNDKLEDLVKAKVALLGQTGELKQFEETDREIAEKIEAMSLAIDQEITSSQERYNVETRKQSDIFVQSNIAVDILSANAELLTASVSIEGLLENFFRLTDPKAADLQEAELRKVFEKIGSLEKSLEKALARIEATEELKVFHASASALNSVRGLLFSRDGIVATVRSQMAMEEKAKKANKKLKEIVSSQGEKGRKSVTVAQGEQEKAISSVNNTVRFTILLIAVISAVAVVSGIGFGIWVYRSISRPLNHAVDLLQKVSQGDLAVNIETGGGDEIGRMLLALQETVLKLREIITGLMDKSSTVVSSATELTQTAEQLSRRAHDQASQSDSLSTAADEMSQVVLDVAKNAQASSSSAEETKRMAIEGEQVVREAISGIQKVSDSITEISSSIDDLYMDSNKIGEIASVIKDIADQTNLLALNAAIEAARAGEQGRGFAVVADSVRQLAEKTAAATTEISAMIRSIQTGAGRSVKSMKKGTEDVSAVVKQANKAEAALQQIVRKVEHQTVLILNMANASNQQSTTVDSMVGGINNVADTSREFAAGTIQISQTAEALDKVASELQELVKQFRV